MSGDLFSETPASILSHHADAEAVDSFLAYRKKHKRAALTERGAQMLAKSLLEINQNGGDATEALDMAQEHGWQTIKPDWYWRSKGNEQPNRMAGQQRPNANAGVDQIAFAARARRTPGADCF